MPEEMRERQEKRSTRLIPGVGFLGGRVVEDAAWMCDPASFVLPHRTAFDGGTSRHPPPPALWNGTQFTQIEKSGCHL